MGMKLLSPTPLTTGVIRRQFEIFDDFKNYTAAEANYTATLTDSGTVAAGDVACGVVTLTPSDGTVADNDEAYLSTVQEVFLFAADKPIFAEARIQFTEANTDDANVIFGLMSAAAANALLDDGGGPAASYSGAVFFKVDGGTTWWVETSIGGTQTTTATNITAGGSAYQTLTIECVPVGSVVEVSFLVDGVYCVDASGVRIKHRITLGSPTEMDLFAGVKNGGANNQTLLIDYMGATQLR